MTVRSGKWEPPETGWFERMQSPSFSLEPSTLICCSNSLLLCTNMLLNQDYKENKNLILDSFLHGTQVDWYVGGVGHETTVRAEQGARKVQSFLEKGNLFYMISGCIAFIYQTLQKKCTYKIIHLSFFFILYWCSIN